MLLSTLRSLLDLARRRARPGWRLAARADAARDAGDLSAAAALYRQALALLPAEAGLHVQCGHMLKDIGRLDEAGRHYETALAARPGDADLALQLGHLAKLAGRFADADRFYARAGDLAPGWDAPATERAGLRENGWCGAPPGRTLAQAKATIEASGLFDPDTYRRLNPDLGPGALAPLDHFLMIGVRERRRPHPLFDVDHYFKTYRDVGRVAGNPLDDFLTRWRATPRDPNPFFDTALYLSENPDVHAGGLDPLSHYIRIGAPRGARPSRRFDPAFYLAEDPTVPATGLEPLEHYLLLGRRDGRRIHPAQARPGGSTPVGAAALRCLKPPSLAPETALVVAHAPGGRLKPHVARYLEGLRRQGIAPVLIAAVDGDLDMFEPPPDNLVDGLYLRDNGGYDFAAWAHVLADNPALYGVERLILSNDSLFGPTNDADFGRMLARARAMPADLVGVTDCQERAWHIQSFFLLLKAPALRSAAFRSFMASVVSFAEKDDVVFAYECKLASHLSAAGLACGTLFAAGGRDNATLFRWKALLDAGFPFVKVRAIRDTIAGVDRAGWREALGAQGYDTGLVDQTLAAECFTSPENER